MAQVRVGWRAYVSPASGTDADAQSFVAAAGIADSTQISAINALVADLKAYGIWTKMKAIYPFVGGSAASNKFNLKDPRDLNAAYRLLFYGGWTHSVTGAKPNGTTGYAETYLNNNILGLNDISFGVYFGEDNTISYDKILASCAIGAYNGGWGSGIYTGNNTSVTNYFVNNSNVALSVNSGSSKGMYIVSKTSASSFVHTKGSFYNPISFNPQVLRNATFKIGRAGDWAGDYNLQEQRFTYIGNGLDQTEISNLYIAIQKFQTTLGRHVGTPYVSDADAIAFLTAAGITDGTQASAINTLVIRMKADGVWTKMKAVYPFVGGTAFSHKFNLKDPRDLDAAFRLVFTGGWTHTSTGALPNGTTGYADTKLSPSSVLTINSTHFSFYSRTNNAQNGADMGSGLVAPVMAMRIKYSDNNGYFDAYSYPNGRITINMTSINSTNLFIHSRTSTNIAKVYRLGIQIGGGSVQQGSSSLPSGNVFISSTNDSVAKHFSNRESAFASIGDGLTDAEAANLYSAVQAYQTTLGRQTDVPLVSDTDAQAFLNAANITSFQQASAVNKLVIDLKAAGVWTKMRAVYPFVGGSAASHKWNLKDPRDLDAAFRLVFNGGGTHGPNGYLGNGSNSFARTYITHNTLSQNNTHVSFYNRYNSTSNYNNFIGCIDYPGTSNGIGIYPTNQNNFYMLVNSIESLVNIGHTSVNKFWMINRNSSTQEKVFINGSLSATINKNSQTGTSKEIYLGSINGYGNAGINESSFASIGDGLTDAEATAFYTAVQTYQTSLGRAVNAPVYNNGLVLNLDAGNANSYPGTGTTWFDLAAGNNGTLVNGPTYDAANGGSIVFDGTNDHVITNDTSFRFGNKFSMNLWFYWDGLNKTNNSLFSKRMGSAGNYNQYAMGISNGDTQYGGTGKVLFFYARVDGSTGGNDPFDVSITYTLPTAGFYNACIVMDTNSQKLYVNGILVGSNSKNLSGKTYNIAGRELILGAARGENATDLIAYASTKIHRFSVYSYSLTETEVISNFNSTRGRFGL